MRIISGSAKGRKLAGFNGKSIRPTSDRVREAVFSSLFSQIGNFSRLKVLDLFAGTGAMAIEALSRGATSAVLVDQNREAVGLIAKNLATADLNNVATVINKNVKQAIPQLGADKEDFDLIFIDPPYADDDIEGIVQSVNDFGLLRSGGIMCVETSEKVVLPDDIGLLTCVDRRKYGATAICYYKHRDISA